MTVKRCQCLIMFDCFFFSMCGCSRAWGNMIDKHPTRIACWGLNQVRFQWHSLKPVGDRPGTSGNPVTTPSIDLLGKMMVGFSVNFPLSEANEAEHLVLFSAHHLSMEHNGTTTKVQIDFTLRAASLGTKDQSVA